mgnify:CR=1 FL=1
MTQRCLEIRLPERGREILKEVLGERVPIWSWFDGPDGSSLHRIVVAADEVESVLDCNGRVVLRPSGTEPVIRVMVEGVDAEQVETLVEQLTMAVVSSSAKH